MWGNFVPDLGKLGEQLTAAAGEALQKASADVEKSIDNTLGIKGGLGEKAAAGNAPVEGQAGACTVASAEGAAPLDPTAPNAAPSAKPGQKKIVKKIVRRVVKGSGADATVVAAAGTVAITCVVPVEGAVAMAGQMPGAPDPSPAGGGDQQTLHPDHPERGGEPLPAAWGAATDAAAAGAAISTLAASEASHADAAAEVALPAGTSGTSEHGCSGTSASNGDAADAASAAAAAELSESLQRRPSGAGEGFAQAQGAGSEARSSGTVAASLQPHLDGPAAGAVPDGWGGWPEEDLDLPAAAPAEPGVAAAGAAAAAMPGPADAESGASSGDSQAQQATGGAPLAAAEKDSAVPAAGAVKEPGAGPVEGPTAEVAAASGAGEGSEASAVADGANQEATNHGEAATATGVDAATSPSSDAAYAAPPARPSSKPVKASARTAAGTKAATQKAGKAGMAAPAPAAEPTTTANGSVPADAPPPSAVEAAGAASPSSAPSSSRERQVAAEAEGLRRTVAQLQSELQDRDAALQVQAVRVSDLQQVVAGLQTRNEELALRSAGLSEADFEAVRTEFEQRLAAAERKVYALSKERDALRKGAEKIADYGALVREKDDIIKQVMDEGEKLSKKQVELEGIIKRLRGQLAAAEGERDKVAGRLAAEETAAAELRRSRARLEKELQAAGEQAKAELEAQREHFEMLLQRAKSDQVDAEERARDAAAQGLGRRLRESEARCEALAESCAELRDALDRQRQAADLREEMLKADMSDLERRCQAAELRHQDLAAKVPEATRPLLRQIEAMQAAGEAQAEAWAGAEAALHARIADAEGRAAAAAERERLAVDKMQLLAAKASGLDASLAASRAEVRSLNEQLEEAAQALGGAREAATTAARQSAALLERCRVQEQQLEQMELAVREHREAERSARAAAEHDTATLRREYERRLAEAEGELGALQARVQSEDGMRRPEPPAMAAPGYRWVLLKEGEQPPSQQPQPQQQDTHAAAPSRHPYHHSPAAATAGSPPDLLASLSLRGAGGGGGASNGGGGGDGVHAVMASELEALRGALRAKTGELAAAQQHVAELEATRDRLAEELVAGSARSEAAVEALQARERLEGEVAELRIKLNQALELVGERDEQVEELRADLQDVKCMYKDQIEFMCQQLAELQGGAGAAEEAAGQLGALGLGHGHGMAAAAAAPGRPAAGPAAAMGLALELAAGGGLAGARGGGGGGAAGRRGSQSGEPGAGPGALS